MQSQYEQALLQAQLEIQEQTFANISDEIHDNIGQILSLVRLKLNTLGRNPSEDKVDEADELLGGAINDLRHLSHNLNASHMMDEGLAAALENLLHGLQKTGKFETTFQYDANGVDVSPEKSLILFRISQEVINNVIKHACATEIAIKIEKRAAKVSIILADNGKGFNTENVTSNTRGLGLKNIIRRAALIDTEVTIDSVIDRGTVVTLTYKTTLDG